MIINYLSHHQLMRGTVFNTHQRPRSTLRLRPDTKYNIVAGFRFLIAVGQIVGSIPAIELDKTLLKKN